jgi:hypothetical protein
VHEPPLAFVSHKTGTRLRIKVPSKRKDQAFFSSAAERMSAIEGVTRVEVSPLTGSILLLHSSAPDHVIERANAEGFFRVADPAYSRTHFHRRLSETFAGIDDAVRGFTGNELDTGAALFVTLLALGIYQIWKGNAAAIPWYAAGWYALNIFMKSNGERHPQS